MPNGFASVKLIPEFFVGFAFLGDTAFPKGVCVEFTKTHAAATREQSQCA